MFQSHEFRNENSRQKLVRTLLDLEAKPSHNKRIILVELQVRRIISIEQAKDSAMLHYNLESICCRHLIKSILRLRTIIITCNLPSWITFIVILLILEIQLPVKGSSTPKPQLKKINFKKLHQGVWLGLRTCLDIKTIDHLIFFNMIYLNNKYNKIVNNSTNMLILIYNKLINLFTLKWC